MKHCKPFSLELTDRVLRVTAFGVWTLVDAREYVRQMRLLVQPVINNDWACILDARLWKMSPAEVFSLLRDNTLWCYQRKLMYAVTLLPDDKMLQWQFIKTTEMEKPEGFVSRLAEDDLAAYALLRAAGYMN